MKTRVKICGITRSQDAAAAVAHGADAIGLVFYERSPRCVTVEKAASICKTLPPFVTTVALFVNASEDVIARVVDEVGVDLLQFHGDESAADCADHRRPWIKAIRMKPGTDLAATAVRYVGARGLLLDAYRPDVPGGTGDVFDWDRIPPALGSRIVLAGGLDRVNVGDAVRRVRPYAVDVSSGVEAAKGIKDTNEIKAFIDEVRRAEQ